MMRQCVALGLAASGWQTIARGREEVLKGADFSEPTPGVRRTDCSFPGRGLQPGPTHCCSGSRENPGDSFQTQWLRPCGRSARPPLPGRPHPTTRAFQIFRPCGLLLLGSASASRRGGAERNAGTHRLLLNCGRRTTQLLGGRLGGSRLGKLLQSTQFAGTPRCSVVCWTFGHQSLLEITVERRRDHTQLVGRTDSGVWVDLSELHQSLGMFGSRLNRVWAGWGLVGPRLGLVAPRLSPVEQERRPVSHPPRAGLWQFVTSLATWLAVVGRT
jgi:hypothetical protein